MEEEEMQFFQFTEEQEMLRKAVREFVEAEVAPHAKEWMRLIIAQWNCFPDG